MTLVNTLVHTARVVSGTNQPLTLTTGLPDPALATLARYAVMLAVVARSEDQMDHEYVRRRPPDPDDREASSTSSEQVDTWIRGPNVCLLRRGARGCVLVVVERCSSGFRRWNTLVGYVL